MTKGKYRVGVTFNPSANPVVDELKLQAAKLIDMIEEIPMQPGVPDGEFKRLVAHAQTLIEDGAMIAVKAATKQPMIEPQG